MPRDLLALLQPIVQAHQAGEGAVVGDHGGAVIERRGHMRGIWRCMGGTFAWTPAGYNEPTHQVPDLDAALSYTQTVILTG